MTSNGPAWRRFERFLSSNSEGFELDGVNWEYVYSVSASKCVGEVKWDCFSVLRWCVLATWGFPNWDRTCSCFIVESSLDAIKNKSICALHATVLSFWTEVLLTLLGLMISKIRSVKLGCLHTSSNNLFKSTFDWVQRLKLLWMSPLVHVVRYRLTLSLWNKRMRV